MSDDFIMPSLGADMEDGVITEWRVVPGDEVRRGQIVVVVETDKSDIEVEIFHDAIVEELLVAEGDRVAVGTPIARLRPVGTPESTVPETGTPVGLPVEPVTEPPLEPVAGPVSPDDQVAITSPLVRHLADRLHVDTATIAGSGPGGRIRRADVEAAARPPVSSSPSTPSSMRSTPPVGSRRRITPRARRLAAEQGIDLERLPVTDSVVTGDDLTGLLSRSPARLATEPESEPDADPTRRAVAALMTRSWAEIPHFHVGRRLDIAEALAHITEINDHRPIAQRILPVAVLLHAVGRAAGEIEAVNGWWRAGRFVPASGVDLGIIVARRGGGIVAPCLGGVDRMSVDEVMVALVDLVGRARASRLRSSDVGEASITVSNLGDLGADYVHGVIHPPQVALVGFGAIHDEVIAVDGQVVARPVVHATVAGDHRAIDGLVAAAFLESIRRCIIESAMSLPPERPAAVDDPSTVAGRHRPTDASDEIGSVSDDE